MCTCHVHVGHLPTLMSHHRVYLYKGCALNFTSNICNHTYTDQQLPTDVCDDGMERDEKKTTLVLLVIVLHMHEKCNIQGLECEEVHACTLYMRSVEGLHGMA